MKIICNQLSVYRDKKLILDRIDCKIQSGQFIAIIGANGSGKSTLLESIGGFLPYQKGSILFDHIEISQWKPKDLARHRAILR